MSDYLRTEINGVEYFSNTVTGESGMSQIGLARACGVVHKSIQKLEKTLFDPATKTLSEELKPFVGKDLNLATNAVKRGGKVNIYTAEFCSAVIKHYAYKGSQTARKFDRQLGIIGLTSYIQSQTGWLPEKYKAAPQAHINLSELFSEVAEWEDKNWEDLYSYQVSKGDWAFSDEIVFSGFSAEEYSRFLTQNPTLKPWNRKLNKQVVDVSRDYRIEMFLKGEPEIRERVNGYFQKVESLLKKCPTGKKFSDAYQTMFGEKFEWVYTQLVEDVWVLQRIEQNKHR